MLLAIDIGNSSTKFGVFDSTNLIDKFAIPTTRDLSVSDLHFDRLKYVNDRAFSIDRAVVCSVVPELNDTFRQALKELLAITPTFVDHAFDFGLKISYDPVTSVGIDRLVNASSAVAKYGAPVMVCSFGTATTIDLVNSESEYVGGVIAPGMRLLAEALQSKTSQLPRVAIERPEGVIGNTTEASIKSGVFYGYIGLVNGILERLFTEIGARPKVIATGGFASMIADQTKLVDTVDENLTLDGLRALIEKTSNARM
jgi:type III pantothenate kinase